MGVSKNTGTPKWMVYNGKPYLLEWMIWGETPLFLETPILVLRDKFLNLNVSGILGWNSEILLLFTTIWGMFFRREEVVTHPNPGSTLPACWAIQSNCLRKIKNTHTGAQLTFLKWKILQKSSMNHLQFFGVDSHFVKMDGGE